MKKIKEGDQVLVWDGASLQFLTGIVQQVLLHFYEVSVNGQARWVALESTDLWPIDSKRAHTTQMKQVASEIERLTSEIDDRENRICRLLDAMMSLHDQGVAKKKAK